MWSFSFNLLPHRLMSYVLYVSYLYTPFIEVSKELTTMTKCIHEYCYTQRIYVNFQVNFDSKKGRVGAVKSGAKVIGAQYLFGSDPKEIITLH